MPGRLPLTRPALAPCPAQRARWSSPPAAIRRRRPSACAGRSLPTVVIPPGVDIERFTPLGAADRSAARARFGLEDDDLVVVSVSRLVPRKGMDTLIRAAARLRPRFPALRVLIAGRGRDRERLGRLVAAHRRPGRVPRLRRRGGQGRRCSAAPTCSPCCAATAGAAWSRRATASCSPRRPRAGSPSCADARAAPTRPWSTSRPGSSSNGPRRSTTPSPRWAGSSPMRALRARLGAAARRRTVEELTYDSLASRLRGGLAAAARAPPLRPDASPDRTARPVSGPDARAASAPEPGGRGAPTGPARRRRPAPRRWRAPASSACSLLGTAVLDGDDRGRGAGRRAAAGTGRRRGRRDVRAGLRHLPARLRAGGAPQPHWRWSPWPASPSSWTAAPAAGAAPADRLHGGGGRRRRGGRRGSARSRPWRSGSWPRSSASACSACGRHGTAAFPARGPAGPATAPLLGSPPMADPCTIGIDVGGTKVLGLALDPLEPARPLAEREVASAHGAVAPHRRGRRHGRRACGPTSPPAPSPRSGSGSPGWSPWTGCCASGRTCPGSWTSTWSAELAPRARRAGRRRQRRQLRGVGRGALGRGARATATPSSSASAPGSRAGWSWAAGSSGARTASPARPGT